MLESYSLFQSPLGSPKEYIVDIPNLDPAQPLFIGLSIFAKYHNRDYFRALICELYDLYINNPHKNGRIIMVLGGGDLLKRNLMAQWGVEDEKDFSVQTTIIREEQNWEAANLNLDEEVKTKVAALKANGKLEFYHWNEAKVAFAAPLKESAAELSMQLTDGSQYHDKVMDSAIASLSTKRDQPAFANMVLIREGFVLEQCIAYSHEEGKLFAAWGLGREEDKIAGEEYLPQMAYPISFGTEADKPNISFFETITAAVKCLSRNKTTMNLLDIKFTSRDKLALTTRRDRKLSLDSQDKEKQQEKQTITALRLKIRRLQEETQQLTRQANQILHLFVQHNPDKDLPRGVSLILTKKRPPSHPPQELDTKALAEVTHEKENTFLANMLEEVTLRAQRLQAEVGRLEEQNQKLHNMIHTLENEELGMKDEEIHVLEEEVENLENKLRQARTFIIEQAMVIYHQALRLHRIEEEILVEKEQTISALTTSSHDALERAHSERLVFLNIIGLLVHDNFSLRNTVGVLNRVVREVVGELNEAKYTIDEKTAELTLAHDALADAVLTIRFIDQEAKIALEAFADQVDAARALASSPFIPSVPSAPRVRRNASLNDSLAKSHANLMMLGPPPKRQVYSDPGRLHVGGYEKAAETPSRDTAAPRWV